MANHAATRTSGKHFEKIAAMARANRWPNEKVFVEHSTYARGHIKERVLRDNLLPYTCQSCNIEPVWNGKPLVLHLDHINGDSFDHRLCNLRFLCPNCHTQEPTYSRGQKTKNNKARLALLKETNNAVVV